MDKYLIRQCSVKLITSWQLNSFPFQKENNLCCANVLSIACFFLSARQFGNDVKSTLLPLLQRQTKTGAANTAFQRIAKLADNLI